MFSSKENVPVKESSAQDHQQAAETEKPYEKEAVQAGFAFSDEQLSFGGVRKSPAEGLSNELNGIPFQQEKKENKSGVSLDKPVREEMENRLDADFAEVKIHTDANAAEKAKGLHAKAFTLGNQIYFGSGAYNHGTLAHELMHVKQTGGKENGIRREFDRNTATQRIQGTGSVYRFALRTASGELMNYDAEDNKKGYKGGIYLPNGTMVSKLDANPASPDYIHVIAWFNGKYREGYVHSSAFSGKYKGGEYDAEVFVNDAWHELYRAKLHVAKSKNAPAHIQTLISELEKDLKDYENGSLKITNEILKKINVQQKKDLKIDPANKPETQQRLSKAIFSVIDPKTKNGTPLSQTTVYVPLTDTWFHQDAELGKYYDTVWYTNGQLNRIGGETGEGIQLKDDIDRMYQELFVLQGKLKNKPKMAATPEGQWVMGLTKKMQANTGRMIFLGGDVWTNMSDWDAKYSSEVSVDASFGPLKANPMMLLMLHETNVNSGLQVDLLNDDTHIPDYDTKATWEAANSGKFSKTIQNDPEQLDNLFQSHSMTNLVLLSYYFDKIRQNQ